MPPADRKLDPSKLPGDSSIVLTPKEYQDLLDAAHREGRTRLPPTECRLGQGKVEDGFVRFEAGFDFHAERPDAVFALACRQAKVTAVTKEKGDRTPMLSADADGGYSVQVEQPGDYSVTLSLSVPLSQRPGGGRGFELDLPRAVLTSIDLALPPDARAVRVNGKDVADAALTLKEHRPDNPPGPVDHLLLSGPLGILDKLDLSWQGPAPSGAQSLRMSRCRVTVRVEGGSMTTQADLILHAEGEASAEWTVIVPRGFEVKASAADQPRVKSLTHADDPAGVAWTVTLKAPGADDLTLTAIGPATTLAAGRRAPVGPFLVRGASRQSGVVLVGPVGPDVRPILHPNADLTPHDLTDEERKTFTDAYEFVTVPAQPWLDVEAGAAGGSIKTQTTCAFHLGPTGPNGDLEWQVAATFTVSTSGRTPVDSLDVELSPGCQYVPTPPDPNIKPDEANARLLHVSLGGAPASPFKFTVNARYPSEPVPREAQRQLYGLPRLLPSPMREMQDGGVQIEAAVPDDLELLPPAEATAQDPHHFTWRFGQTPEEVPLSWQPYTPEVRVSSVIDLTFSGRRAQAQHELHLHFTRTAGTQITLKSPAALGASLQVVGSGGALIDDPAPAAGTARPQAARRRAGTGGCAPVFLLCDGTVRGRALLGRGAGEGRRREGASLVRSGPAAAAAGRRLVGAEYRRDRQAAAARTGAGERPPGRAADVGLRRADGRAVGAGGPGV